MLRGVKVCEMGKGQIQLQFNWIFVIIAGAIILSFFAGFAIKYKGLQEEKGKIEVLNSLNDAFTSLQSSYFPTKVEIDLPSNLMIGCNEGVVSFNVGGKSYATDNLIFSSGEMKGKVVIWYMPYKMPFKIANFYYVASKTQEIYIVPEAGTEEFANELKDELGKWFDNVFVGSSPGGSDGGRVVYVINSCRGSGRQIDGVFIVPGSNWHEGEICVGSERHKYLGLAEVYGAIFSEDYGCLTEKIDELRGKVVETYIKKISVIQGGCSYSGFLVNLTDFGNEPSYGKALALERINKEIGGRCIPVF